MTTLEYMMDSLGPDYVCRVDRETFAGTSIAVEVRNTGNMMRLEIELPNWDDVDGAGRTYLDPRVQWIADQLR